MYHFKNTTMLIAIVAILLPIVTVAKDLNSDLRKAAKKGQTEKVQLLISQGANINSTDKGGKTALMFAAERGHSKVVLILVELGAEIEATDDKGETALAKAQKKKKAEIITILRYHRAKRIDTVEAYEQFLATNPDMWDADPAQERIKQLKARERWKEIESTGTLAEYRNFIQEHSDAEKELLKKVRIKVEQLSWQETQSKDSIKFYQSFLRSFPSSSYSDAAKSRLDKLLAEREEQRLRMARTLTDSDVISFHDRIKQALNPFTFEDVLGNSGNNTLAPPNKNTQQGQVRYGGTRAKGGQKSTMTFGDFRVETLNRQKEGNGLQYTVTIRRYFKQTKLQRISVYKKEGEVTPYDLYQGKIGSRLLEISQPDEKRDSARIAFERVIFYQENSQDMFFCRQKRQVAFCKRTKMMTTIFKRL